MPIFICLELFYDLEVYELLHFLVILLLQLTHLSLMLEHGDGLNKHEGEVNSCSQTKGAEEDKTHLMDFLLILHEIGEEHQEVSGNSEQELDRHLQPVQCSPVERPLSDENQMEGLQEQEGLNLVALRSVSQNVRE